MLLEPINITPADERRAHIPQAGDRVVINVSTEIYIVKDVGLKYCHLTNEITGAAATALRNTVFKYVPPKAEPVAEEGQREFSLQELNDEFNL